MHLLRFHRPFRSQEGTHAIGQCVKVHLQLELSLSS